jgi:uncharacterized membrane protein YgaE (UPF0421/DUF939 family)
MTESATQVAMDSVSTLSSSQFGAIIVILFFFLGAFIYFLFKQNEVFVSILRETKEEHKEVLNNITEVLLEVKNEVHLANRAMAGMEKVVEYERSRNSECYNKLYAKIEKIEDNQKSNAKKLEKLENCLINSTLKCSID